MGAGIAEEAEKRGNKNKQPKATENRVRRMSGKNCCFWSFYIRREMKNPLILQWVKEWCTHQELNLKPADP
jgi:hypothetical protein